VSAARSPSRATRVSAVGPLGRAAGGRSRGAVLLRALDGDLQGGTPALRRRLFAVICVVVVCELLVILAVGTNHAGGERPSARSGELPARSDAAAAPTAAGRPAP
jgi:hypothetical protein